MRNEKRIAEKTQMVLASGEEIEFNRVNIDWSLPEIHEKIE